MANEKYHLYRVSTTKELCYQNVAQKMKTATLYGGLTYDMDSTTMCNESRKYHPDANDYLAYRGCRLILSVVGMGRTASDRQRSGYDSQRTEGRLCENRCHQRNQRN